jgi:hypothetical protein
LPCIKISVVRIRVQKIYVARERAMLCSVLRNIKQLAAIVLGKEKLVITITGPNDRARHVV